MVNWTVVASVQNSEDKMLHGTCGAELILSIVEEVVRFSVISVIFQNILKSWHIWKIC